MAKLTDSILQETVKVFREEGTTAKTAVRLRLNRATVSRRLNKAAERGMIKMGFSRSTNGENEGSSNKNSSFSRDEFREQFDIETQTREAIRKAIKELNEDEILGEPDFRRDRCGISSTPPSWRPVIVEDEFLKYQFICDQKIWWADSDTVIWACDNIAKARPM